VASSRIGVPASEVTLEAELFRGYTMAAGTYDEVFAAPGQLRPAWLAFQKAATSLTRAEYVRRWEQAQRLLRQNSLAYPDLRDPTARRHPWELDGFPLLIGAEEWAGVEAALKQRAQLLDLVLCDLFGPQRLVRDGLLPPDVLFRHPGFRLPLCRGPLPWGSASETARFEARRDTTMPRMLQFYAADLARGLDGRWWVLGDRCESASGAGFALENRIALSRMLPDVFRTCRVERLASYFIAVKEQLARLAPQYEGEPKIVLLSQAAGSINYFEDAFLARYLGYTLAEAGDLAVRRNQVFLKSLAGLTPVNVLIRRPNSEHCDPLELADEQSRGVAGLLQSARSGHVAIANTPGSGLVESPVFMAFLPALCEALLGEPLLMPGVATWWCGDPIVRARVLERLEELTILPAFRRRGQPASETSRLAEMPKAELAALISADPANYVGQEKLVRSTAPVLAGDQLSQSYIALRTFAVAQEDNYVVMPGGLARVSPTFGPLEVSLLDGERSKDCWVLADGQVEQISLLTAPDEELEIRRGGVDLSSRAAEHFFWLGRHAVRAESLAKLLRSVARRLAGEEESARIAELPHLMRVLAEQGQIEPGYVVDEIRLRLPAIEKQLPKSAFDELAAGGLRAAVTSLASLAATVRDLMSLDSWRIIRQMDEDFRPTPSRDPFLDMLDKIDVLLMHLAAYSGQVAESMTRTNAWRFLDFGRRLERALQEAALVRGMLQQGGAEEPEALEALLEVADSVMTYRSRYASRFQLGAVLDLMICDETNPRSVAYQLVQLAAHTAELPQDLRAGAHAIDQGLSVALLSIVRRADVRAVAREYEAGDTAALDTLLSDVEATLPELSDLISHRYFFHSGPMQRLAELEGSEEGI
jgi:uncharacterized circularly permuted ATP-grasp superfamily protein/uncharacterized alpha-E superfamily protein